MSVNRDLPHVLILPEDDANRQIANGFSLNLDFAKQRQLQVLHPAGGWLRVLEAFESDHIRGMNANASRFIVLLIDFDCDADRMAYVQRRIPPHLADRVFVLGAFTNPEDLKRDLGSFEEIGCGAATDCRDGSDNTWRHDLLKHNAAEFNRLRQHVHRILF